MGVKRQDFYFADLDMTVTFYKGFTDTLHKNEIQLLSLQVHSLLNNFLLGRALYAAPLFDKDKIRGSDSEYGVGEDTGG